MASYNKELERTRSTQTAVGPCRSIQCSTPLGTPNWTGRGRLVAMVFLALLPRLVQSAARPTASPPASERASTKPGCIRIGAAEGGPKKISGKNPQLSERARSIKTTGGMLIYDATIDEEGRVRNLKLLKPIKGGEPWPEIERDWRAALTDWRYEPVLVNGKPVSVCLTIGVNIDVR